MLKCKRNSELHLHLATARSHKFSFFPFLIPSSFPWEFNSRIIMTKYVLNLDHINEYPKNTSLRLNVQLWVIILIFSKNKYIVNNLLVYTYKFIATIYAF